MNTDTKPWYKQFWPWFIISLPAAAVIAGLITVYIAFKNADSLVVDEYYKEGKAINLRTALLKKASELGYQPTLERLEGNFIILKFGENKPSDGSLVLDFVHPTSSDKDFGMQLNLQKDGSYQGLAPNNTAGRWYLRLSDGSTWLIKTELAKTSQSVTFIPASF